MAKLWMKALLAAPCLAVALASLGPVSASAQVQPEAGPPTALSDILVDGRPLRAQVQAFVGTVAAPAGYRGPARWSDDLCVGVANLASEPAQMIADRISDIGAELGLKIGGAGCKPNLVVMFADDGAVLARDLVRTREKEFLVRTSGASLGRLGLADFQNNDRPIRWWAVSIPVNEETGRAAVRVEGQASFSRREPITQPSEAGDFGIVGIASRLTTIIKDQMQQALVIVDINKMGDANLVQIADYAALVGLVQIDPTAETRSFDTILNLFEPDRPGPVALTSFDWAYLRGVYGADQRARSGSNLVAEVATGMERELRREH